MSEADDTAELAAASVARKQTNNWPCCIGACQDQLLPLLSDVLPMLHLRITRRLPSLQIAEKTDGDIDQVQGV